MKALAKVRKFGVTTRMMQGVRLLRIIGSFLSRFLSKALYPRAKDKVWGGEAIGVLTRLIQSHEIASICAVNCMRQI